MVHNNKILTVSYGTFSCTLEGFDDSFGTMKAIAEYFRDLASDDRYFGAEPPQPDADMLARIAQREISRKVEAHTETNGIVLRAQDFQDNAAPAASALAAAAATQTAAPEPAPELPAAEPTAEVAASTEAEQPAPLAMPMDTSGDIEEEPFDVETPLLHVLAPVDPAPDFTAQTQSEPVTDSAQPAVEDVTPVAPEQTGTTNVSPIKPVSNVAPPADSIAAKLQRIRAVVSQNEAAAKASDFTEDEHADAFMASAATEINAALDAHNENETTPLAEVGDDEISRALDRLDAAQTKDDDENADQNSPVTATVDLSEDTELVAEPAEDVVDAAEDTAAEKTLILDTDDMPEADETAADFMSGLNAALAEDDDSMDAPDALTAEDQDDSDNGVLFSDLDDDQDDTDIDLSDMNEISNIIENDDTDDDDNDEPRSARVLKVKRADLEAAIAAGDLEEIEDDDIGLNTSLTAEAEADLQRELAEVEEELSIGLDDLEYYDADDADLLAADDDAAFQTPLPTTTHEAEEDLSRLMAAAEEKMEEPETSSSRDTYNQLRAAVAAAEAEKSAGGDVSDGTGDNAYREDLASVVRPRRPVAATTARPERPNTQGRAAPLKLVAEQRVDVENDKAQRGPVRPRRVSAPEAEDATTIDAAKSESGFVDFASEMGATELPDLLEAAAAYMSFVEGRDQFSRPQLMNKVRQVETTEFNREDGLRSFGQLLRQGKIEKTGGGRFTASGEIGFRPDERAVG